MLLVDLSFQRIRRNVLDSSHSFVVLSIAILRSTRVSLTTFNNYIISWPTGCLNDITIALSLISWVFAGNVGHMLEHVSYTGIWFRFVVADLIWEYGYEKRFTCIASGGENLRGSGADLGFARDHLIL